MKKLGVFRQKKCLVGLALVLLFLSLGYDQFNSYTGQPLVRLGDKECDQLRQYQRMRSIKHYEFKLQPRQSPYCAGRIYCVEQSAAAP